jgi:hypothetical protein
VDVFLLRAVRVVVRADSDPARQALFRNLKQASLPVRLVVSLHDLLSGTIGATLLVACYGLGFFLSIAPPLNRRARFLLIARHANARRHVARVAAWIGEQECGWVGTRAWPLGRGGLAVRRAGRVLDIIRRIDRRHGFLVSSRVAALVAWYSRGRSIIAAGKPEAVIVSSNSNPEEVGITSAARALRVPTVFIAHAYPTPFSPPLDFSLSILEGEGAVQAYCRKGPITGQVLLAGLDGESAPLDVSRMRRERPVIGLFTPKAIAWPTFKDIVDDCRNHCGSSRIVIRWHPSMLEPPRLGNIIDDLADIRETPRSATLEEVAAQCDWVVADENSGVHLPVLRLGIPTIPVKRLGLYPPTHSDLYGFVANRVVYPAVAAIREVQVDELAEFYSGGWTARFQRYDASYLRPSAITAEEVRRVIAGLSRPASPALELVN